MDGLTAPQDTTAQGVQIAFADLARRASAQLRVWLRHAANFGSAGSMALAALLGVAAFAIALAAPPPPSAPVVTPAASRAPVLRSRLTDISARGAEAPAASVPGASVPGAPGADVFAPGALTPVGAPPPAAIETVLDYDVVFFWPTRPQTVAEPVAIRQGPASFARVIRSARPGERLRINGRVDAAPNGPWLRVRLADGQDGYFVGRTVDVGAWRQRRAAEAALLVEAGAAGDSAGAPLVVTAEPDPFGEPQVGPPSF